MEDFEMQLLVKGCLSPYITKTIIANNYMILFTQPRDLIGKVLSRYYYLNDVLIDKDTLKEQLKKEINRYNQRKLKVGKEEMSTEEIQSVMNIVDMIFTTPDNNNPAYIKDLENWVKNKLTTNAILQESANNDDTLAQRVEEQIDKIKDISLVLSENKSIDVTTDLDMREHIYEQGFSEDKVFSGFKPLDSLTGGLARGNVACVAASSGGFKTGTLSNLAYRYAINRQNVLYITLEEKAEDVLLRLDKLFLNVDNQIIFDDSGRVSKEFLDRQRKAYTLANEKHKKLNLIYKSENPMTLTARDVEQILINEERNRKIKFDVLILDYADLLKKRDTDNESMVGERLFQELSRIAHQHNVLLWTGSQLNRSANSSEIKSIENVEGSYRKINICSLWLTINATKEEREQNLIRYYVDKVRNMYGVRKDFLYLKINPKTFKIESESPSEVENHKAILNGTMEDNSYRNEMIKKSKEEQKQKIDNYNQKVTQQEQTKVEGLDFF